MNRKSIPLLIMLTAGAVTWAIAYIQKYSVNRMLVSLFVVMVIFYVLGSVLTGTVNYFERQNEEKLKEEGEVIEKDAESEESDPEVVKQEK